MYGVDSFRLQNELLTLRNLRIWLKMTAACTQITFEGTAVQGHLVNGIWIKININPNVYGGEGRDGHGG